MTKLFFDELGVFQWASIAAIVSLLAFIASVVSIFVTIAQNNKNRKSTTLVKLRIEELKKIREIAMDIDSEINSYINSMNSKELGIKEVNRDDTIINILDSRFTKLQAMLYQYSEHTGEFSVRISECRLILLTIKNTVQLTKIRISIKEGLNEYSRQELLAIEQLI